MSIRLTDRLRDLSTLAEESRDTAAASLLAEAADEIERLRLTDAEREALSWFTGGSGPVCPQHLATIRSMMERLS